MRGTIVILLLAASSAVSVLSGCGTSVESADQDRVLISYHNFADSPDSLQPLAEEQCAPFERSAVYRGTTLGQGTLGLLTALPLQAEFECRAPYQF